MSYYALLGVDYSLVYCMLLKFKLGQYNNLSLIPHHFKKMIHLWNGILLGLALSILVGPIVFALIQVSMEQGIKAGTWVGLGIWISDLLFIIGIIIGVNQISSLIDSPFFTPIIGILGGFVLIFIGVGMFISKPVNMEATPFDILSSKWKLFLDGFLINTLNPFTVIFWTSVITSFAVDDSLFSFNSFLFFGSILTTIICTDGLKIVLAETISKKLQPFHVLRMRKISGVALFLFGIAMIVRVSLDFFQ